MDLLCHWIRQDKLGYAAMTQNVKISWLERRWFVAHKNSAVNPGNCLGQLWLAQCGASSKEHPPLAEDREVESDTSN
jgi:hypothetical protein